MTPYKLTIFTIYLQMFELLQSSYIGSTHDFVTFTFGYLFTYNFITEAFVKNRFKNLLLKSLLYFSCLKLEMNLINAL